MEAGINYAVVLSKQLFARVLRDPTKGIVDIIDYATLIGDCDYGRLIESKPDVV